MTKTFISPSKYVQGRKEIFNLGKYVEEFGNKVVIIGTSSDLDRTKEIIVEALEKREIKYEFKAFDGTCSRENLINFSKKIGETDVLIGIGGGKGIDFAKGVSFYSKLPLIIVPTIASTDGPCSSIVALYNEVMEFEGYLKLLSNPNLVLVDIDLISKAPTRFLVAGIGDALSTYFEALAYESQNKNGLHISMGIAKLCYETIKENALEAIKELENKDIGKAFESIVEANILLSCLGFENTGLSLAHSINNHLSFFPETNKFMHGEKVAFGLIVQLILEESIYYNEVYELCKNLKLPVNFEELEVINISKEELKKFCEILVEDVQVKSTFPSVTAEKLILVLEKL